MQLDCFPPLHVVHTDKRVAGRVYIPLINWYALCEMRLTSGFS